ncbi:autotransporter assembly complex protein TamA [Thiorhodovibrio frisius]|uniref:Outer membrane protein n=1 Tax=Thiorhodovibrio frisius TaxID=631362 RepID=H8Z3L7_9GAMM|nr:autotransporter assembly complex family protein [Thiorhodovibrio frisius]EIC20006.1 outer membrane protein [Thiorhodovibrio frisius]WPL20735.1 Autotransporter assembly factor TamA [Thiorhodovibrio frisius]
MLDPSDPPAGATGRRARRIQFLLVAFWLLVLALWLPGAAVALELKVEVTGLRGEQEKNVLALLGIYQERADKDISALRLLALHRRAPEQIRKALAPFGLYRVSIQDTLTEPATDGGTWVASYKIDPGPAVRIASIDYQITGPGASAGVFPDAFPMQVGEVLLDSNYTKARDSIETIASEQGYLDATMTRHQVLVNLDSYEARVFFHLDTGPRYYFGQVSFEQDLLAPDFLQRFVPFESGAVYDPDDLLELQGRLLGSEYYQSVEINPHKQLASADREVPITVIAKRNKANRYRVGLGYGTDVGPRLTLDYRRRYIGRHGHTLNAEISLSAVIQTIFAEYDIPVGDPLRDSLVIKPQYGIYDTATRQGTMFNLQTAWSHVGRSGWRRDIGLNYQYEDFEVSDVEDSNFNGLVPSIAWSKIVADDPINTRNGYRVKALIQGTVGGVMSTGASWLTGSLNAKWIKSFGERYRFLTRADLGATWAANLEDVPAGQRFFAGGDTSIRGWAFDVLGPIDPVTDQTLGGRYLAVGSLELQRQIKGKWSASVFTDFGNAFDPEYDAEWEQSAGLGLNYQTPLGQVRFYAAYAFTKPDPGVRLHLMIGPDL